ncbi:thiol-disulfide oxidoreductase DCC family protein [Catenovulum maritimum]|uniref:Thiol-disulfide oxidoreductase n=1 Tax=Catenovulum maritimum TaxID=1513271 RepID=A0A0J8JPQ4_9ALTE|nr:DUF393 domain-containing protein [Catenovulum maritimum]KMT66641.1 hypothetical protein XM47_00435 [Catenovulum maritimum]
MTPKLTIFYDSYCPLCINEMQHLAKLDKNNTLAFADIHAENFTQIYPSINIEEANLILHAECDDGDGNTYFLYGLDVTHKAWKIVGRGYLIAPLRWPIIRFFADKVYLWFARNRYQISYWLTGKKPCESNQCKLK